MTKEELNEILSEVIAEKSGKALAKMETFSECPKMFAELQRISPELANAFRSIILFSLMINPDRTEGQVITDFYNRVRKG